MISFKLDKDNNIVSAGNIATVSGTEALTQDIKTRLGMTAREYPFNVDEGIDYLEFLRQQDKRGLLEAIQERVLSDPRVSTVDLDSSQTGRILRISLTTTGGEEVNIELD